MLGAISGISGIAPFPAASFQVFSNPVYIKYNILPGMNAQMNGKRTLWVTASLQQGLENAG